MTSEGLSMTAEVLRMTAALWATSENQDDTSKIKSGTDLFSWRLRYTVALLRRKK
jgi:hypothetical protein